MASLATSTPTGALVAPLLGLVAHTGIVKTTLNPHSHVAVDDLNGIH